MIARFVGRLGGVLTCAVLAACSASQPAAPSNTGPEELNYSREMPTIATGDLAARGTVASSSDQTPFYRQDCLQRVCLQGSPFTSFLAF